MTPFGNSMEPVMQRPLLLERSGDPRCDPLFYQEDRPVILFELITHIHSPSLRMRMRDQDIFAIQFRVDRVWVHEGLGCCVV